MRERQTSFGRVGRLARTRSHITVLTGAAVVAGLLWLGKIAWVATAARFAPHEGQRQALAALVVAVGNRRPTRARLTGGFAYGPAPSSSRGAGARVWDPNVLLAAARLEKAVFDGRSSDDDLAALATARLTRGQNDSAITLLRDVTSIAPTATRWSDLAAGYLARGREDDLVAALDAVERALSADPTLEEALFNRGLSLAALHLDEQAASAWNAYLARDSASPWAEEARTERRGTVRPASGDWTACRESFVNVDVPVPETLLDVCARAFPLQLRELVDLELLAEWGNAYRAKASSRAAALSTRAEELARKFAAAGGDQLTRAMVRSVREAAGAAGQALAAAHVEYRDAKALYDRQELDLAEAGMRRASVGFRQAGSAADIWTAFHIAVIAYHESRLDAAAAGLARVRDIATRRQFLNLLARVEWMESIINVSNGRFADATRAADLSRETYRRTGETESEIAVQALQADNLRRLGLEDRGWTGLVPALEWLARTPTSPRRQMILHVASLTALQQERHLAARYFFEGYLRAAEATSNHTAIAEAYLHRARLRFSSADREAAKADLAAARQHLSGARDRTQAQAIEARILLAEAEGLHAVAPQHVVDIATKAIAHFESSGRILFLPRAMLARARAYLANGQMDTAERDLLAGVDKFEQMRVNVDTDARRVSYFDEAWGLFDALVGIALTRGRADDAFAFAERGRARGLLDTRQASASSPMPTPAQIAGRLPAGTMVLSFTALEKRLVVWAIGASGARHVIVPVTRAALTQLAGRWRRTFDPAFPRAHNAVLARELGRVLLGSIALTPGDSLLFVPDGPLHDLPLAALVNPHTGRTLIEDHAVAVTPRASALGGRRETAVLASSSARVLSVGNAQTQGPAYAALPRLPSSEREARDVAARFADALLLVGRDATREAFARAVAHADVVHFAGHGLPNVEFPDLSSLVFAGSSSEDVELRAADIERLPLSRVGLVVLSACGTAAGASYRGEGQLSLARPFMNAGVPFVIATLWPIEDEPARLVFRVFYQALREGVAVPAALRRAQLASRADVTEPAHVWSAFRSLFTLIRSTCLTANVRCIP